MNGTSKRITQTIIIIYITMISDYMIIILLYYSYTTNLAELILICVTAWCIIFSSCVITVNWVAR